MSIYLISFYKTAIFSSYSVVEANVILHIIVFYMHMSVSSDSINIRDLKFEDGMSEFKFAV